MSGFVRAWPERLIKNKSQRYERPGTTTVKPRKETGKINVRDNNFLLHRSSFPFILLSLKRKISLVILGISFCRALPNRDFTVCVARAKAFKSNVIDGYLPSVKVSLQS